MWGGPRQPQTGQILPTAHFLVVLKTLFLRVHLAATLESAISRDYHSLKCLCLPPESVWISMIRYFLVFEQDLMDTEPTDLKMSRL